MFALLFLTLVGSYVNIPVAELPAKEVVSGQQVPFFGMRYIIPYVVEWPRTIIAVNLGGAVIPTILSIYLLIKNKLYLRGLLSVVSVTVVVYLLAHPVRGVGIAVPIFIPPLVTTAVVLLLSRQYAAPLAYIAGSLGTLVGADLPEPRRNPGTGGPGRIYRRGWHLRWHFCDRNRRCCFGEPDDRKKDYGKRAWRRRTCAALPLRRQRKESSSLSLRKRRRKKALSGKPPRVLRKASVKSERTSKSYSASDILIP